ncbi:MAG: hypothetical protein CMJ88_05685 [Planctomycetes bacterium]|nr:hypothetical protein [Planctomycetota bacterium]
MMLQVWRTNRRTCRKLARWSALRQRNMSGSNAGTAAFRDGALRPGRSRWEGPLEAEQVARCRERGIALAYDCAQSGWVAQDCADAAEPLLGEDRVIPSGTNAAAVDLSRAVELAVTIVAAQLRAIGHAERGGSVADEASRKLQSAAKAQVDQIGRYHGVRGADVAHWALQVLMARAGALGSQVASADAGPFSFRPWTVDDAEDYRALLDNPNVWSFLPEPYPGELSAGMARTLIKIGSIDDQVAEAVLHDGKPVGQCLLRFQKEVAGVRCAEVAYWLGEQHWGQGWMKQILPVFLRRAMQEPSLDVVYAWIRRDHDASQKVARHAGMRRDEFSFQGELASAMSKPECERWVIFRPWVDAV